MPLKSDCFEPDTPPHKYSVVEVRTDDGRKYPLVDPGWHAPTASAFSSRQKLESFWELGGASRKRVLQKIRIPLNQLFAVVSVCLHDLSKMSGSALRYVCALGVRILWEWPDPGSASVKNSTIISGLSINQRLHVETKETNQKPKATGVQNVDVKTQCDKVKTQQTCIGHNFFTI